MQSISREVLVSLLAVQTESYLLFDAEYELMRNGFIKCKNIYQEKAVTSFREGFVGPLPLL